MIFTLNLQIGRIVINLACHKNECSTFFDLNENACKVRYFDSKMTGN